jgi:hypothetical protein
VSRSGRIAEKEALAESALMKKKEDAARREQVLAKMQEERQVRSSSAQ